MRNVYEGELKSYANEARLMGVVKKVRKSGGGDALLSVRAVKSDALCMHI